MNTTVASATPLLDFNPRLDTFREDFIAGLGMPQKRISPKYLYDARGAKLFDRICELEEYFPTRTEARILRDNMPKIRRLVGSRCRLVEFGSGSSLKTQLLLEHLDDLASYVPIDIAREHLIDAADRLSRRFPETEILPVCADYTDTFHLPRGERPFERTIVFFPGSTIGNFTPPEAVDFLRKCGDLCGPDGGILIGVALQTDPRALWRAYNDAEGVTAEFNCNLLHRARRELGASVDTEAFHHSAVYDRRHGRVEMRLVSEREQEITLDGRSFRFAENEYLLTEYSYKFTLEGFESMAAQANLKPEKVWVDERRRFSVHLLGR